MPGGHITDQQAKLYVTSTKPTAETLQPPRRASAPAQQRGSMPILDCRHRRRHRADGDVLTRWGTTGTARSCRY
jgi:hypothetical protein